MTDRSRELSSQTALDVTTSDSEEWHDLGSDSARGCVSDFQLKSLVGGASPQVDPTLEMSPDQANVHVLDDTFSPLTAIDTGVFFQTSLPCFRYVRWTWVTQGTPSSATADTHHEA